MSLEELASVGITEQSISAAIRGSHKGWLFEERGLRYMTKALEGART